MVSKKSGGADDSVTRMRLLSDSKVVGGRVMGGWKSCALHGAGRTLASQLKRRAEYERSTCESSYSGLSVLSRSRCSERPRGWRQEAANRQCQEIETNPDPASRLALILHSTAPYQDSYRIRYTFASRRGPDASCDIEETDQSSSGAALSFYQLTASETGSVNY